MPGKRERGEALYTIRIYQMGNGEDAGKTSAYNIDVSVQWLPCVNGT